MGDPEEVAQRHLYARLGLVVPIHPKHHLPQLVGMVDPRADVNSMDAAWARGIQEGFRFSWLD
jgi:hypothetical protein